MKKVFITGATTGIGEALALHYATQGWVVGLCGRDSSKWETSKLKMYSHTYFYEVDVMNREALLGAVQDFYQKNDGLDLFIANAGIGNNDKKPMPNFSMYEQLININVLGVIYSAESCYSIFARQRHGQFVAVSSVAGLNGLPGNAAYCASKSAVLKLCESWAIDWRQKNIAVTCLLPGFIATPLTKNNNHKMPFLMTTEQALPRMIQAIEQKKAIYIFPFRMYLLTYILSILPRNFYIRIMSWGAFNLLKKTTKENNL